MNGDINEALPGTAAGKADGPGAVPGRAAGEAELANRRFAVRMEQRFPKSPSRNSARMEEAKTRTLQTPKSAAFGSCW